MSADGIAGTREVAYRVFAAEFDDATLSYSESDEERAPNYVVTPTGARLNRTFVTGVLTEVEDVNEEVLRGRVADPTGAFVTYAGQYQPEPMAFLKGATPPTFVALTGKARTYQPDDSDVVFTSIRPESVNAVDADVRDRWVVSAARATLRRVAVFDEALSMPQRGDALRRALEARGVDEPLAAGVPRAIDHYGTTRAYLEAVRTLAVEALELVAGERDQVATLATAPDEGGETTLGPLPTLDLAPVESVTVESTTDDDAADETADAGAADDTEAPGPTGESTSVSDAEATAEPEPAAEPERTAESESEGATDPAAEQTAASAVDSEPAADSEPTATTESADATASAPTASSEATDAGTAAADSTDDSLGDFDDGFDDADTADDDPSDGALGDFDDADSTGDGDAAPTDGSTADDDVDPNGMYELDEEERAEIESEFGTEFTSGSDVAPAGEADIDVPDADDLSADAAGDAPAADSEQSGLGDAPADADDGPADATESDADSDAGDAAVDVDLETAVVDAMDDLDDGDGADREAVVAAVVDEYGADPGAVDDAIQDALLGGRCYEPQEDVLKAI